MCGIMGYVATEQLSDIDKKYVSLLAKNLLVKTAIRGTDATGYMAHFENSNKTIYYKNPVPAHEFVLRGSMNFKEFPETLIGHTRMATSGEPVFNSNNHPLMRKKFGLVHNGTIYGWKTNANFKEYREEMYSDCDSELLAVYLEKHNHNAKNLPELFRWSADYAFISMMIDNGYLTIGKNDDRPLAYADMSETLGIILISSTFDLVEKALNQTFKSFPDVKVTEFDDWFIYSLAVANGLKKEYQMEAPTAVVTGTSVGSPMYSADGSYDAWDEEEGGDYDFNSYMTSQCGKGSEATYNGGFVYRMEPEVRHYFKENLGHNNYMHYLREFADRYFDNQSGWETRELEITMGFAENFCEAVWESDEFLSSGEEITV